MTMFERKTIKQVLPLVLTILMPLLLGTVNVSVNAQSPVAPRYWLAPINNIRISGGTPAGRTLLSVGADGSFADLFRMDDKSGRQRWLLQLSPDGFTYNILIAGGTPATVNI